MLQAIVTKWIAPTNTKRARINATCCGGSITVECDPALFFDEQQRAALNALTIKMGWTGVEWTGRWISGGMPDRSGDAVFVYVARELDLNH